MWIQSLIIGLIGAVSIELPTELWDGMLQAMYKSIFEAYPNSLPVYPLWVFRYSVTIG